MASPIGHIMLGVGLGAATPHRSPTGWWLAFAAFAACAPDLDFLPGFLVGDINRYHQLASHSFTAALLFGVAAAFAGSRIGTNVRGTGLGAAVLYASHLAVDLFTQDVRPPYGIPLFWPFYGEHFMAPWTPFGGIRHGVPGDPLMVFLSEVFSRHNLAAIGIELALLGPIGALAAWLGRRNRKNRADA